MNLFELAAKISLNTHDFEAGIKAAISTAEKAATVITDTVEKITSVGETAAKVVGGVATTVAAGIAALTKSAVEDFSEYEQLVGGVETLFKESASAVAAYANGAYKTAGMSANDYMEAVTSFSASLLQGLKGDTAKAAKYADQAITDMSDNANKMGTDISMIQNTYQGFAKQNYAMLDNLKLGYGGTASEMARLINDSGVLGKKTKVTAKTVNEVSFDKIIEAIHVIQTEMGISGITYEEYTELVESGAMTQEEAYALLGTTAKEASSTIQGSLSAAKAAWTNLSTGLADDTQDMDTLISNFVDSVVTAAGNIIPRVKTTLSSIASIVDEHIDEAGNFVAELILSAEEQLPEFVNLATKIVKKIVSAIKARKGELKSGANFLFEEFLNAFESTLDEILPLVGEFAPDLVKMFLKYKTTMFKAGVQIIVELAKGLAEDSDELSEAVVESVNTIVEVIADNIDVILNAGYTIIVALANALLNNLPELQGNSGEIVSKIIAFALDKLPDIFGLALDIIKKLGEGLADSKHLEELGPNVLTLIDALATKLTEDGTLNDIFESAATILGKLAAGLTDPEKLAILTDKAQELIDALGDALETAAYTLGTYAGTVIKNLADYLTNTENLKKIEEAGEELGLALGRAIAAAIAGALGMDPEDLEWLGKLLGTPILETLGNEIDTLVGPVVKDWLNISESPKNDVKSSSRQATTKTPTSRSGIGAMGWWSKDSLYPTENLITELPSSTQTTEVNQTTEINITQNIYSDAKTAADLMQEARWEAERSVLEGVQE